MNAFHLGLGLQITGLASVGHCLFHGMANGDYGHRELILLVAGSLIFYLGSFLKSRTR